MTIPAIAFSPAASSQAQQYGFNLNPALWTVQVRLQNGQMKFVQFSSEAQADADIQRHSYGTKIAPQGTPTQKPAPAPATAAQAPAAQAPAAPATYVSATPAVPYQVWVTQRPAQGQTVNPAQWTVEVRLYGAGVKFVQFPTEQQADADIARFGYGIKIAPQGVAPKSVASYAALVAPQPVMRAPVAVPAAQQTATSATPVTQAANWAQVQMPPTATGWWQVYSTRGWSWKFDNQQLAQQCVANLQAQGVYQAHRASTRPSGGIVGVGINPPGPTYR